VKTESFQILPKQGKQGTQFRGLDRVVVVQVKVEGSLNPQTSFIIIWTSILTTSTSKTPKQKTINHSP